MGAGISSTMVCFFFVERFETLSPDYCPGHAGAMLQARQLGDELLVGIHSDEAILENKGPTVMTLKERYGQPNFSSAEPR